MGLDLIVQTCVFFTLKTGVTNYTYLCYCFLLCHLRVAWDVCHPIKLCSVLFCYWAASGFTQEAYCFLFVWFDSLRPINNLSVIKGHVFLGWTSTKLGLMCLAQGHNPVTYAIEARTHGPSVLSQALYHWTTALPQLYCSRICAASGFTQ